jgi:hypothetical protein
MSMVCVGLCGMSGWCVDLSLNSYLRSGLRSNQQALNHGHQYQSYRADEWGDNHSSTESATVPGIH